MLFQDLQNGCFLADSCRNFLRLLVCCLQLRPRNHLNLLQNLRRVLVERIDPRNSVVLVVVVVVLAVVAVVARLVVVGIAVAVVAMAVGIVEVVAVVAEVVLQEAAVAGVWLVRCLVPLGYFLYFGFRCLLR